MTPAAVAAAIPTGGPPGATCSHRSAMSSRPAIRSRVGAAWIVKLASMTIAPAASSPAQALAHSAGGSRRPRGRAQAGRPSRPNPLSSSSSVMATGSG
jgi:hypothetical protein